MAEDELRGVSRLHRQGSSSRIRQKEMEVNAQCFLHLQSIKLIHHHDIVINGALHRHGCFFLRSCAVSWVVSKRRGP